MRNQVTLIGNMGDNAQITNFENGGKVARFNLAISSANNKGDNSAEWHRLFAFGNLAQFIENFGGKGKRIAVTGRLVNRTSSLLGDFLFLLLDNVDRLRKFNCENCSFM